MEASAGNEPVTVERLAVGPALLAYVRDGGPSTHPPLLLLHGFVGSSADWDGVRPRLATDREVIAYDHRGHGDSTKFGRRAEYTFDRLTEDLRGFLDGLGLDRVDLLGHSMGGVIAQRFALAHPSRVRSLVLMDTAAAPSSSAGRVLFAPILTIVGWFGLRPLATLARRLTRPGGTPQERARQQRALRALAGVDRRAFVAFGRELGAYPSLLPRLGELGCPTTVLVGERDRGLRPAALALSQGIPGARLVVLPGAGHNPQTERPDQWLAAVREHLDRLGDDA